MTMWNTNDARSSNFVLYIEVSPHFLIFAPFQSIFSMTVCNTNNDRYSKSVLYIGLFQKKDHFFGQKISKILCLAFDFICIYYMSSDY